jgi:hypothetical protein
VIPGSLSLSFSLSDINGGAGLSVTGGGQPSLNPFNAAASLNVAAEQVPEPGTLLLGAAALACIVAGRRLR